MNMLPAEAVNARAALKSLPPLIKGYLRLGAYIGDGAVIDHQFGTTDADHSSGRGYQDPLLRPFRLAG